MYSHRQSATTSIMQIINIQTWKPEFGERVLCLTKRCICSQARCSKWKDIKWGLFTSVSSVLFISVCVILQLLYSSFYSHISFQLLIHYFQINCLSLAQTAIDRSPRKSNTTTYVKWLLFLQLPEYGDDLPIAAPAFPNPALTLYPISLTAIG